MQPTESGVQAAARRRTLICLLACWALCLGPSAHSVSAEVDGTFEAKSVSENYEGNIPLSSTATDAPETAADLSGIGAAGVTSAAALAEASSDSPQSANELFGLDEPAEEKASSEPETTGELFGEEETTEGKGIWSGRIEGFYQNSLAYTYPAPGHFSKFKNTLDVSTDGRFSERVSWKAGARFVYDAIYDLSDFYPSKVKSDQGAYAWIMETYLDVGAGDWELRLGRQNVIWGETVGGLFVADVVSGLDLREFIVQELEMIRIPQWAARAEYFKNDFYAELLWIPVMTVNEVGVPGAQFFSFPPPPPPGFNEVIAPEPDIPISLDSSAGGVRGSYLTGGWDTSLFYYTSLDRNPAYQRTIVAGAPPTVLYTPVHKRIHQIGATTAKDLGSVVFSVEAVYTMDRLFNVTRLSDADGLTSQNVFQYLVAFNYVSPEDFRVNVQLFQQWLPNHDPDMIPDKLESGASILLSTQSFHPDVEPELLWITSFNETDWLFRARLNWDFHKDWTAAVGVDIFEGPPTGLFGQFDDSDRVYYEIRYTF